MKTRARIPRMSFAWKRTGWFILLAGTVFTLSSCATTTATHSPIHYFVPPVPAAATLVAIDPPSDVVPLALYTNEVPQVTGNKVPAIARPSDGDFLIHSADEHFAAGKKAIQESRKADARKEFDRSIEVLLTAPENIQDRARLQRRLEELIDSIYRYDVDELGSGQPEEEAAFERSPLDSIRDMTFPIDPSLRNRVQDQIRMTASQLPLEVPDPVVSFVNYFSSTQGKKILMAGLRNAGKYKPMIDRILREEGVPQELIYLAQAESGFQPRARSYKECVGLWQFAGFRGREYGLTQNGVIDERMDPEKATRAAARHLRDLYNHFGDWYLAMAAFNCGPGCVDQAVMRTGYADYWTLLRLGVLPSETKNYVPIILAMTVMAKNPHDYGLDDVVPAEPVDYDTIELESATHLALLAQATDHPLSELRELNPSLMRLVAPSGFSVHVPKGTSPLAEAAFRAVPASKRDSWRIHRVDSDDTFASLAKRYGTLAASLSSANRDSLPEAGSWAAVPVTYPGDPVARARKPVARTSARGVKPAALPTPGKSQGTSSRGTTARTTTTRSTPTRRTSSAPAKPGPKVSATTRRPARTS